MRALCGAIITAGALIGLGLAAVGFGLRYGHFSEVAAVAASDSAPVHAHVDMPIAFAFVFLTIAACVGLAISFLGLAYHHHHRHHELLHLQNLPVTGQPAMP
jgi:formate hydrogenlyase subunit 3/multisubunit Na+/H+ antiporter MnhD subunit